MKKSIIIGVIITILLLGGIGFTLIATLANTQQRNASTTAVTFVFTQLPGATVSLHINKEKESAYPQPGDKIVNIEPNSTHNLDKNTSYVAVISGTNIQSYNLAVYPKDTAQTIRLQIERTAEELEIIKKQEAAAIMQYINEHMRQWLTFYTIDEEDIRIVSDGSWATVKLVYKGSRTLQRDSLFTILQKQDTKWVVVAPPAIVISKPDYPNIPDSAILAAMPVEPPAKK